MQRQKVLVIVGPTASGKSALGVKLAKRFNGEIISADSRQVYTGLDIGTGKITKREMHGIPHHLLDVVSPKKVFSAGDFSTQASRTIASISKKGALPMVVGGTGFYIDALLGRSTLPEILPDKVFRARMQKKTAAQLYRMLDKRDPQRARMMASPSERNNKVRLIRALEIVQALGKVPKKGFTSPAYDVLWIGINPSFITLEKNILLRLKARIKAGMIAEAKRLHKSGLSYKRMEELGLEYRSLARLLQNKISRKEFEDELYRDIRRYAKKQLTYWKRNEHIVWFPTPTTRSIELTVRMWMRD